MNSVGVLCEGISPTAGWLSSTFSPAIPRSLQEDKQGQWIPCHARFMKLVEILCNLSPLLRHFLQGSFPTNPLHLTGGATRTHGWMMQQVLRCGSYESIYHSRTTVSSSICLLSGIFWGFGKVIVPISASSPGEIITENFNTNSWMTNAIYHIHGAMFTVKTMGLLFRIPKGISLLVVETSSLKVTPST